MYHTQIYKNMVFIEIKLNLPEIALLFYPKLVVCFTVSH